MSNLSEGREDSRSETFSDVTETNRRARFPSLHTGPEEFVTVPWNERRNTDEKLKLTVVERIWYWLCGISRKVWFIVGGIFIGGLSIIIVGLILLFVLPNKGSGGQPEPQDTAPPFNSTTTMATTITPIPYPAIINIGSETTWFPIGFMESMAPDNRGYNFRDRILVYNPNSTYLLINGTFWNALLKITQPDDCFGCKLLSASDGCLLSGSSCSNNSTIFCCKSCSGISQVCLLHGSAIATAGEVIEWRISTGGSQLLLTESFITGRSTALQTIRANGSSFFQTGPLEAFQVGSTTFQSAVTLDPDNANQTDLFVFTSPSGQVTISYRKQFFSVDLKLSGAVLSLDTTVFNSSVLIAVLQSGSFHLLRFNLDNHCISKTPKPIAYLNTGQWMGSFFAGDKYYLWYNDIRSLEGVTIFRFSFFWPPDDSHCPYSPPTPR